VYALVPIDTGPTPCADLVRANEPNIGRSRHIAYEKRNGPHPLARGAGRSREGVGGQMPRSRMIFATWPVALTL
jgi:hypothetical protein